MLRYCLAEGEGLALGPVSDGPAGREGWEAAAGNLVAHGGTPWDALQALAGEVEGGRGNG